MATQDSIGFANAQVFGQEGAILVVVDIADDVHERAAPPRGWVCAAVSHTADLTKMDQVRKAVGEVIA